MANEDSGGTGTITRAVEPTTCACCGVKWYASREAPQIDNLVITENAERPKYFALHVRCNDYVRSQIKAAIEDYEKRLAAAGITIEKGGRVKIEKKNAAAEPEQSDKKP